MTNDCSGPRIDLTKRCRVPTTAMRKARWRQKPVGLILVVVVVALATVHHSCVLHQQAWQNPSIHVDAKAGASAKSNSSHHSALLIGSTKRVSGTFSIMAKNGTSISHAEVVVASSRRIENDDEHQTATSEKSNMEEIRSNKTNRPYFICKYYTTGRANCANSVLDLFFVDECTQTHVSMAAVFRDMHTL
jgi:hypothetical protein